MTQDVLRTALETGVPDVIGPMPVEVTAPWRADDGMVVRAKTSLNLPETHAVSVLFCGLEMPLEPNNEMLCQISDNMFRVMSDVTDLIDSFFIILRRRPAPINHGCDFHAQVLEEIRAVKDMLRWIARGIWKSVDE